ncbi:MAG: winged helix-turn-helix transcriptional regulator [Hyphomonadaceae bacterium]|nr:winged helix-turn-helix transcriptional regulator [Hyphomonadaceae bacterium]
MAMSPKGAFALSQSPSHLLHRAQQFAQDRFAAAAGARGITLRQFAVLAAIAEQPGRSQTDLVLATGVDRSTLADMITRMEKRSWILRVTAADDARANAVTLAPGGRAALNAAIPFAKAADEALMEALPRGDRKPLLDFLAKLSEAADAAANAPARAVAKSAKTPRKAPPKKGRAGKKTKKGKR